MRRAATFSESFRELGLLVRPGTEAGSLARFSVLVTTLAMNRVYTTQAGERKEEVCYMTIVVWGKQGEHCAQYLKKGRSAHVEGHLQQRS